MDSKKITQTSLFKDHSVFQEEITNFANKYKTTVVNHSKRTSNYFEMTCYNYIIEFYEKSGYVVSVQNLQLGKYKYKCTTQGIQSNFSFFLVTKSNGRRKIKFEIQHNLNVQSSHDRDIFTTPDISIIKQGKVKNSNNYYDTNRTFSYVENNNLISFCEVKQFTPYPELLFNFIGVLNELRKEYMINEGKAGELPHIAPSLMISGKPNKQTGKIRDILQKRYCINIFYDLFYSANSIFSKRKIKEIRLAGKIDCLN